MLEETRNYTCIETMERQETSTAQELLRRADLVRVEVAFVNGQEVYALPGKPSFTDDELSRIIGSGFTASGLFAAFSRGVFLHPAGYRVVFGATESLDGVTAFRYDYWSSVGSESWNVRWAKESGFVGEQGSFWLDSRDLKLLRLTVSATNIPSNLPYSRVRVSIDYASRLIGGQSALVPQTATVNAADHGGTEWLNRIDFSQCHRFEVGTKVLDLATEELVENAFGKVLPPGLEISVDLLTPISIGSASVFQSIEARIVRVVDSADVSLPPGTLLRGKIRRLGPLGEDAGRHLVSLEFDSLETQRGSMPFVATLRSVSPARGVAVLRGPRGHAHHALCKGTFGPSVYREECGAPIPGVVNFILSNGAIGLDRGLRMRWRTSSLGVSHERTKQ